MIGRIGMELTNQIEQKVTELTQLLDQLDPDQEAVQVGRSLRIALGLARYKSKQRQKGAVNEKPKDTH